MLRKTLNFLSGPLIFGIKNIFLQVSFVSYCCIFVDQSAYAIKRDNWEYSYWRPISSLNGSTDNIWDNSGTHEVCLHPLPSGKEDGKWLKSGWCFSTFSNSDDILSKWFGIHGWKSNSLGSSSDYTELEPTSFDTKKPNGVETLFF